MLNLRNVIKISVGLLISIVAIAMIYRQIEDGKTVLTVIQRADWSYIVFAAILPVLIQIFRAIRWYFLIRPIHEVGLHPLFAATNIGFATTNLFPLRLGEVIRPLFLSVYARLPLSSTVATVVAERIFDFSTILSVFVLVMLMGSDHLSKQFGMKEVLIAGMFGVFILFLLVIRLAPQRVLDLLSFASRPLPPKMAQGIMGIASGFSRGLAAIRPDRGLFWIIMLSFAVWGTTVLYFFCCNEAFSKEFEEPLPVMTAFLLLLAISLAASVPSSPGFIGVFHYAYQLVLVEFYSVNTEIALSIALVSHAVNYLAQTLLGIGYACYDWGTFESIVKIAKTYLKQGSLQSLNSLIRKD